MPEQIVTAPDGKEYVVTAPEGATREEIIAYAKANIGNLSATKSDSVEHRKAVTRAQISGVGHGVLRSALGVGQLAEQGLNAVTSRVVPPSNYAGEALNRLGKIRSAERKAIGVQGYDWPQLAGEVLGPTVALTKLPAAASVIGRIGQGALRGTAAALTQPVSGDDYWWEKASQAGTGAAFGGVISGLGEGLRAGGRFIAGALEPATETGRRAILTRELQALKPGGEAGAKIVKALRGTKELVPGSKATAGQAIADIPEATGLSSYQRAASKVNPESQDFFARQIQQEAARAGALNKIAGDQKSLKAAAAARDAVAKKNYARAAVKKLTLDDEWNAIADRPSMKQALGIASEIAKERGGTASFDKTATVDNLHNVKLAIDGMLKNPERYALGKAQEAAIQDTRSAFLDWLTKSAPEYDYARRQYHKMSEPINRMEVLQYLKARLNPSLGNRESAAVFTKAVEEAPQTLKKSTGYARYKDLSEVLSPEELQAVQGVAGDLKRTATYARQASATTSGTTVRGIGSKLPNLLSRPAMVVNFVLRAMGRDADVKINKMAAEMFLNPEKLADALSAKETTVKRMVADGLVQRMIDTGIVASAVSAAEEKDAQ